MQKNFKKSSEKFQKMLKKKLKKYFLKLTKIKK